MASLDILTRGHELQLGDPIADAEHATIAGYWRDVVGSDELQFPLRLARLKRSMRNHFDHEAALIKSAGATMCACHHGEHEALLRVCDRAAALQVRNFPRARSLLRSTFAKRFRRPGSIN